MSVSAPPPDLSSPVRRRRRLRVALALVGGVAVVAPIAWIVMANLSRIPGYSQAVVVRQQVQEFLVALELWASEHGGRHPVSLEALLELDAEGRPFLRYSTTVPVDAWGKPFVYSPHANGGRPRIVSYGRDGMPGGKGIDADIDSAEFESD